MKNITTNEKIVFAVLLVFVSSLARATEVNMAFSKALIVLTLLFLFYKLLTKKIKTNRKKEV
ncbi:MAG: hypothetical protein HQ536_04065 [Parcubacteria group bacterium]|nr:hypothetical protein [Parcubacteria group bacterium]